jgi:hypothetical protein
MGATFFELSIRANNPREGYSVLVEEAEEEYGNDQYSGTIATTNGFSDFTNEFKNSKLSVDKFIAKKSDDINKRDCACICIEEPKANTNKIKSVVEHDVFTGTRKWELLYIPMSSKNNNWKGAACDKKGDAVTAAREYTEKTGTETVVMILKRLSKTSGNDVVARIKYKPSTTERKGKYIFFGWAAE